MAKTNDKPVKATDFFSATGDGAAYPAAIFKGAAPATGSKISITVPDGTTYRGTVSEATEADGEVYVEFHGGLTPEAS